MMNRRQSLNNLRSKAVGRLGVIIGIGLIAAAPGIALAVQTVPNPPEGLLFRRDLSIPTNPIASGSFFTNASVTYDNGSSQKLLNNNQLCALAWESGSTDDDINELHPYTTDTVRVLTAGKYTFRVVNSPGISDTFLALLSGTFDKANPDAGVLGCNDDIQAIPTYNHLQNGDAFNSNGVDSYAYPPLNSYWSLFEVDLQPGTYTVLLSTFNHVVDDAGWYQNNGDLAATSYQGTATSTFEYWGPPNGLEIVEPSSSNNFGGSFEHYLEHFTDLPRTGTSSSRLGTILAAVGMALGSILIVISRRRPIRI